MKKPYEINYADNTITVTRDFYEKMQNPSSEEYKLVKNIRTDYPEMRIVNLTHKRPSKYVNKQGEKFNCNQFKNLTYENMEGFINGLPNSEKYMKSYNFIKNFGGLPLTSRYTAVRKWFVAQFPEFRKNPLFYLYNDVDVIDFASILEDEQKRVAELAEKKAKKAS